MPLVSPYTTFVLVPLENMHELLDLALNSSQKINICFLFPAHSKHNSSFKSTSDIYVVLLSFLVVSKIQYFLLLKY